MWYHNSSMQIVLKKENKLSFTVENLNVLFFLDLLQISNLNEFLLQKSKLFRFGVRQCV